MNLPETRDERTSQASAMASQHARRQALIDQLQRYGMLILFFVIAGIFSILRPDRFPTAQNFRSILTENSLLGIAALAVMLAVIAQEWDLSVAAVVGLANVLAAGLPAVQGVPVWATILIVLGIGLLIGLVHSFLIVRLKMDSLVVTIGTAAILTGMIQMYTGGHVISIGIPESLMVLGRSRIFGIQLPFIFLLIITAVLWYILEQRPWGRRLYATGVNVEAARLAGINTDRMRSMALIGAALLGVISGILLAARAGVGHPNIATGYMLPAWAAAYLGTAAIRIGFPNPWGTFLAIYLLSIGVNGLTMIGAPFWVNQVFNGLSLLIGITLARRLQIKWKEQATSEEVDVEAEA